MKESISKVNKGAISQIRLLKQKIRDLEKQLASSRSGRSEKQIIKKNLDLSMLFDISVQLLESLDKKIVLQRIVTNAASLAGTDTSAIYLINDNILILEATHPPLPEEFPDEFRKARLDNHPHIKAVFENGTIYTLSDVSTAILTDEERLIMTTRNLTSLVYIPLFVQKKVEGVIILGTIKRRRKYSLHEIDLFTAFSNITSLALENSYLFKNLTDTKEKAEESNRLKTAFLHNISHEIRTPLNAIVGFSHILGKDNITREMKKEYLHIISQSNNQLLSIIDDILSISHIDARQISVMEIEVNLNDLLENIYIQYKNTAAIKGLEFTIHNTLHDQNLVFKTDEFKLIGIINNLLNNAIKFTHQGRIELGCRVVNRYLEFYVLDTGIGIPDSEHSRIFERFYQLDHDSSKIYGGLGLGLSICAAYVEILGGDIHVESENEKGSRFVFTIALKRVQSEKSIRQPDFKEQKNSADKTILVAEDDDMSFYFIREVLTDTGYNIIRAFNGVDAVNICSQNSEIDLILMDVRMPLKNGYESAAEILKIRPGVPIIFQTAFGYPEDRYHARNNSVDFITKPFSVDQLASMVNKHIRA